MRTLTSPYVACETRRKVRGPLQHYVRLVPSLVLRANFLRLQLPNLGGLPTRVTRVLERPGKRLVSLMEAERRDMLPPRIVSRVGAHVQAEGAPLVPR